MPISWSRKSPRPSGRRSRRSRVRATLERLFDEGDKGELVEVVLAMLTDALSRNNDLSWRLQAALKPLGRKKNERIAA